MAQHLLPAIPPVIPAALAAVLHRYTGRDRVALGIRIAPAEPIPIEIELAVDCRFEELLRQAGEEIDRVLGGHFIEAGSTVQFIVPLELQNELAAAPRTSDSGQGLLHLTTVLADGELQWKFGYPEGEFEPALIAQLAEHFKLLLDEAASNPLVQVSQIQLLRGNERNKVLVEWNDTACGYEEYAVPEIFAAQVRKTPQAPALIEGGQRLTFQELNRQANQLARYLRACGAGPEVLVGFCLENSIRAVVAAMAILKAGAAYVPLDYEHPTQRLQEIVNDSGLSIVVTASALRDRVPGGNILLVDLDEAAARIAKEAGEDFHSGCTPDSAAYIVYTSGSTGRPNGAIGIHRSITNGLRETLFDPARTDEVCCLNGSMSVAFLILGLFLPLLSGVPLVILSSTQYKDPMLLADVIHGEKITNLVLPTPALRQLLSMGLRATSRLQSLRIVMVGGALVTPDLVSLFAETLPKTRLNKGYGSSEIGGIATKGPADRGRSVGRPIANTGIYILDREMNPVPVRVAGEVYVAARHMARGYLNRPELTAARFLRNPFASRVSDSERLYRTGDLARYLPEGEIEFLGRVDDQVKIRGFRVQLGEIEGVLSGHEAVREATVTVREVDRQEQLVAYIVASGAQPGIRELREYISVRLPAHMIPSAFVFLDLFPMTQSGKVDRAALPPPEGRPALENEYAEPRNPVEEFLLAVWSNLLGVERIGIYDDFMELGGDSLFAAQVAARIWDRFDLELPLESLFEHPTVAQLAEKIIRMPAIAVLSQ